ncbi:MAG: hypothetical protein KatS3mg060_2424 [Dehalococcoidia bacterium]|nr:MAG: hypothetical protein KatS3mg060_2424 [Dehalococcoidia bacterium]
MNPSNVIYSGFLLVAVTGALIHLIVSRHTLSLHRVAEILLVWTFVPLVGVPGLFSGMYHVFDPQQAAAAIGWQVSPFQREVGFGDLGIGILGILCARLRGLFWWATGIWSVVFLGGAAIGHIIEQRTTGNFAPGNAGVIFWLDILVPVLLIVLLPIYQLTKDRRAVHGAVQPA